MSTTIKIRVLMMESDHMSLILMSLNMLALFLGYWVLRAKTTISVPIETKVSPPPKEKEEVPQHSSSQDALVRRNHPQFFQAHIGHVERRPVTPWKEVGFLRHSSDVHRSMVLRARGVGARSALYHYQAKTSEGVWIDLYNTMLSEHDRSSLALNTSEFRWLTENTNVTMNAEVFTVGLYNVHLRI